MVQHYTHRRLDDDMRAMMVRSSHFLDLIKPRKSDHNHTIISSWFLQAIDWVAREEERPGVVVEQLDQVELLEEDGDDVIRMKYIMMKCVFVRL